MHPEVPATGHLDIGFLSFPVFKTNAEMVANFQVATACLSCSLPSMSIHKK
jgi:hypothetical protein